MDDLAAGSLCILKDIEREYPEYKNWIME